MRGIAILTLALAAGCETQPPDIRSTITPEAIAASTEPLLFIELTETGQQAIMSLTGRNGDVLTWSTADGKSISLQNGLLIATRGLGFDLMSADVAGRRRALLGGPRQYQRFVSYLDGENQTVLRSFTCNMVGPRAETIVSFGRRVTALYWLETCQGSGEEQRAEFWRVDDVMWRAMQPVGSEIGTVQIERLTGD